MKHWKVIFNTNVTTPNILLWKLPQKHSWTGKDVDSAILILKKALIPLDRRVAKEKQNSFLEDV